MNIKLVQSKKEQEDAFHVRQVVFIKEQQVPEELELDEHESDAIHYVGYKNGVPIAASRIRMIDDYGKLERICVLKDYRGKGYGKQLIQLMEHKITELGILKAQLNAQTHAEDFYRQLGYDTVSGEFLDAGIPHVSMMKIID